MPYLIMALAQGTGAATGPAATPSISLQHFDNDITDSSSTARTWTSNGASVYSNDSKFGGQSWDADTADAYLTTPNSIDLCPWTATSFSFDCWMKLTTYAGQQWFNYPTLFGAMSATTATLNWSFGLNGQGKPLFYYYNGSQYTHTGTEITPLNQWAHIAFTYSSGRIRAFVDGVKTIDEPKIAGTNFCGGVPFTIGQFNNTSGKGLIDEVRITRDEDVWEANFTPPTAPYSA